MTKLRIAGTGVSTDDVTFNHRYFGTSVEPPAPFVLTSSFDWFSNRFRKIYDDTFAELRAALDAGGTFSPPYEGAERYPSAEEVFALPEKHRMEMVNAFFTLDILRLFFTQEAERARWAVRFVDWVGRRGDDIELRGRVERL